MIRRFLYREQDFPGGLRCMDCDRDIEDGEEVADDLVGMVQNIPMNEVICGPCATKREQAAVSQEAERADG